MKNTRYEILKEIKKLLKEEFDPFTRIARLADSSTFESIYGGPDPNKYDNQRGKGLQEISGKLNPERDKLWNGIYTYEDLVNYAKKLNELYYVNDAELRLLYVRFTQQIRNCVGRKELNSKEREMCVSFMKNERYGNAAANSISKRINNIRTFGGDQSKMRDDMDTARFELKKIQLDDQKFKPPAPPTAPAAEAPAAPPTAPAAEAPAAEAPAAEAPAAEAPAAETPAEKPKKPKKPRENVKELQRLLNQLAAADKSKQPLKPQPQRNAPDGVDGIYAIDTRRKTLQYIPEDELKLLTINQIIDRLKGMLRGTPTEKPIPKTIPPEQLSSGGSGESEHFTFANMGFFNDWVAKQKPENLANKTFAIHTGGKYENTIIKYGPDGKPIGEPQKIDLKESWSIRQKNKYTENLLERLIKSL